MGNKTTLGVMGLGQFTKAVLEGKTIRIKKTHYNEIYKFNSVYNIYVNNASDSINFTKSDFIEHFIYFIYEMIYTFEILD